jgi:hypothetical protein
VGERKRKALACPRDAVALDTFGGRIHVEWDPSAAVTPLGPLPFFIEFLKVSGLLEPWVEDGPLSYPSNNASSKREVLATFLLSILAGHQRYAHITALRQDGIPPSCSVSNDGSRKRPPDVRSSTWTKRPASLGWTITWQSARNRSCPPRGYLIWMGRSNVSRADRKAPWSVTTPRNRDGLHIAITAH